MSVIDWNHIHPKARTQFMQFSDFLLAEVLRGDAPYWFRAFEGYRSPARQQQLYDQKRADGSRVTKARPFESAHQYGLAVDFVPFIVRLPTEPREDLDSAEGAWRWDVEDSAWDWFDQAVHKHDLYRPITWDRPHVEHRLWRLSHTYLA